MQELQRSKTQAKVQQNLSIMLVSFPHTTLKHVNPATDHPLSEFRITKSLANPLAWR